MKKMMIALVAMAMCGQMMAQETKQNGIQKKKIDRTEMLKQRTDETAKKLGLNEEQTAKLLELNTQYADKLRPQMRGMRPQGRRLDGARDSMARVRPEKGQRPTREGMEKMREQMKASQEAYDAELQKILTEEQYKAYKADEQKRMHRNPRGGFGQRGQRMGMRPERSGAAPQLNAEQQ